MLVVDPTIAQSIGWRAPTYGAQPAIGGLSEQSLVFDGAGAVFTLDMIADSAMLGGRLKHYSSGGKLSWSVDMPVEMWNWPYGIDQFMEVVELDGDAVVATLQYDSDYRGQVARYRGSDGTLLWQVTDPDSGVAYQALSTDAAGEVIAVGTSTYRGHVAKFDASGALVWTANVDPAQCGASSAALVFAGVAVDANGDVLAGGATSGDRHVTACASKIRGGTGEVMSTVGYTAPGGLQTYNAIARPDGEGNLLVASYYLPLGGNGTYAVSLVRFGASGGAILWVLDPLSMQGIPVSGLDLAADSDGNAVVSAWGLGTQSLAAADGLPRWATPAAASGTVISAPGGALLVGSDFASDSRVTTGRHFTYTALSANDGSPLWSIDLPVNTVEYWDGYPQLAADASGHYAALQSQSHLCCTEQALLAYGDSSTGAIAWTQSDPDLGPGAGSLDMSDDSSLTRSSAATPDGGVVSSGVTTFWGRQNYDYSAQLMTIKRSQRDGHLIWSRQARVDIGFCRRGGIAVDGAGDVLVGGSCYNTAALIKYRGSDGQPLWQTSLGDTCTRYEIEAVAVDVANDLYASGICRGDTSVDLLTVKLAGADGSVLWTQHSSGSDSGPPLHLATVPSRLALTAGGVYVAGNGRFGANNQTRVLVTELRTDDGHPTWTQMLAPPAGDTVDSFSLNTLTALPSGDVIVSGAGIAARLDATSGEVIWSNESVLGDDVAAAVDQNGNVVLAGGSDVWKLDVSNGQILWHLSEAQLPNLPRQLNDIAVTPAGNLLVVGTIAVGKYQNPGLHVAQISDVDGQLQWTANDLSGLQSYGVGVLAAADGSVIAAANGYADANGQTDTGAPWWMVRIVTPQADLIFANGMEE